MEFDVQYCPEQQAWHPSGAPSVFLICQAWGVKLGLKESLTYTVKVSKEKFPFSRHIDIGRPGGIDMYLDQGETFVGDHYFALEDVIRDATEGGCEAWFTITPKALEGEEAPEADQVPEQAA